MNVEKVTKKHVGLRVRLHWRLNRQATFVAAVLALVPSFEGDPFGEALIRIRRDDGRVRDYRQSFVGVVEILPPA